MPKQLCTSGRWNGWKHKSTGPRVKESVHVKAGKGGSCNDSSTPLLARPSSGPPTLDCSQDQIHVTVFYFLFCLHLVYAYLYYTYEVILIVGTHTLLAGKASSVIWILPSFSFLPCQGGAAMGMGIEGRAKRGHLHLCCKCLLANPWCSTVDVCALLPWYSFQGPSQDFPLGAGEGRRMRGREFRSPAHAVGCGLGEGSKQK